MTSKNLKRVFILFVLALIFFYLSVERSFAQEDSADVAIIYTTSYPGRFAEVEVKFKNTVELAAFNFTITTSNHELFDFHTDSIRVETILDTVWKDTCTVGPDSLHGDSCFVVDSVRVLVLPVRFCYIDTVGSLINNFFIVQNHGEVGDTTLPDCKAIQVLGMAKYDSAIAASPNYRTLFKFGVDVFCLPDSTTDRTSAFYMAPGGNSFLSDPWGNLVPFYYHQGDVAALWAVPGDANGDSIITSGDIVFLLNFLYRVGDTPCIPETGDPNGDCNITGADVVYLMNYLYRGGDPPSTGCWYGKKEE